METRQSTKAAASILQQVIPDTQIVYVKAPTVSKFRKDFKFLKVREMNDYHHAKDAYLNIVVGNAYFVKFTSNPIHFIKENPGRSYNLKKMFEQERIERNGEIISSSNAVNEAVIHPAKIAHMIDFHVYINDKFAFSQRSDGLIVSTPTGSTAYSLSAGGPILTPNLNAIALVPMFPHTLSSRPLVIDGDSKISIRFAEHNTSQLELGCDSQIALDFSPDDIVHIEKSPHKLRLLHLKNYNYYNVLSTKLGWLKNF